MATGDKIVNLDALKATYDNIKGLIGSSESTSTAAYAHAKGTGLIYNGILYTATADIAIGDTLVTTGAGANIAAVPGGVTGEVADLKSAMESVENTVDNLGSVFTPLSKTNQKTVTPTSFTSGAIKASDGTVGDEQGSQLYVTVDLSGYTEIKFTVTNISNLTWGWAFYESDMTYIEGAHSGAATGTEKTLTIPEDAVYFRYSRTAENWQTYPSFLLIGADHEASYEALNDRLTDVEDALDDAEEAIETISSQTEDIAPMKNTLSELVQMDEIDYTCGINALNTNSIVGKKYGEILTSGSATYEIDIDWTYIPANYSPVYLVLRLSNEKSDHMYYCFVTNGTASMAMACTKDINALYTAGVTQKIRLSTNSTYYNNHKNDTITSLQWVTADYTGNTHYPYELIPYFKYNSKKIVCWGDSRTAQNWCVDLLNCITDKLWTLTRGGVGGQSTLEIATRQGGVPLMVDEFIIPATTTAVEVDLYGWFDGRKEVVLLENAGTRQLNPVIISGIEGELSKSNGAYYFTRSESGDAVSVDNFTKVTTYGELAFTDEYVTIIFSGANDGIADEDDIEEWVAIQKAMVDKLGKNARWIVIGEYYNGNSSLLPAMNSAQARAFGYHFCDLRHYSLLYALDKAGITPTAQDEADIANGIIPSSLRIDSVHQSDAWKAVTSWLVYEKGKDLGYWV